MAQKNAIRTLTFEINLLCLLFEKTAVEARRHRTLLLCFVLVKFMPQTPAAQAVPSSQSDASTKQD